LHYPLGPNIGFIVDNALDYSAVVANVEKGKVLAVLATASNPATHGDSVANVLGTKATTELGSK
jgi:hypothetical protein